LQVWRRGGEIASTLTERCFFSLDARCGGLSASTFRPRSTALEAASIPRVPDIVEAARKLYSLCNRPGTSDETANHDAGAVGHDETTPADQSGLKSSVPSEVGRGGSEVETDKALWRSKAFHDGYLAGPLADINHEFPVGQTSGFIADAAAEADRAGARRRCRAPKSSPGFTPVTDGHIAADVSSAAAGASDFVASRPLLLIAARKPAFAAGTRPRRHANVAPARVAQQPATAASKHQERMESVRGLCRAAHLGCGPPTESNVPRACAKPWTTA